MTVLSSETYNNETIELRQQMHYWRTMHARAVEREAALEERGRFLEETVRRQEKQIVEQAQQIEALMAKSAWLAQQVFGRKSEKTKAPTPEACDTDTKIPEFGKDSAGPGRKRGKQPGAQGYGRKRREGLPTEVIPHDLRVEEQRCPFCGAAFLVFPGTEDSEEMDWEVHLVRRVHQRTRYQPTCDCPGVPGIVTAPVPPKLIPKGMFSCGFWVHLLLEKYLFQRPLYRIRQVLELEGLSVSQGTLTGGLKRIGELVQPLYTRILERSRAAKHWQMDETRWLVFVEREGKAGHQWWLWVVVTEETCSYLLDPSRSSEVPRNHLGEEAEGILNVDRYSAYKKVAEILKGKLRLAFCWGHVRRDYVRIRDTRKKLRTWAEEWVRRINDLFRQNDRRLEVWKSDPEAFRLEDQELRRQLACMAELRDKELADENLHPVKRKALSSLREHWEGLYLFVDHPEIPMDNNGSERRLRNPVVGRKNYYGSGSIWSGALSAMLFTIFQTMLIHHLDPQKWLLAYFEACAKNGGKPPEDVDAFLPWNLSQERKTAWRYPDRPP